MPQNGNNNNNPVSNLNLPDNRNVSSYSPLNRSDFNADFYQQRHDDLSGSDEYLWNHYQNYGASEGRAGSYDQLINQVAGEEYSHEQLANQYPDFAANYYEQSGGGNSDGGNNDGSGGGGNSGGGNGNGDGSGDGQNKESLHSTIRNAVGYSGNFGNDEFQTWVEQQDETTQNIVGNIVHGGMSREEAITAAITGENFSNIDNPNIPENAVYDPAQQEIQPNELLDSDARQYRINPHGGSYTARTGQTSTAQQPDDLTAAQAEAYTINPENVPEAQAALGHIREQARIEAAQGSLSQETRDALKHAEQINKEAELSEKATVRRQYEELTDFPEGEVPAWAKGAVREAESKMAARGLGSSSVASGAVTGAVLQAAMPIAQQDAQAFAAFENKKLDNRTQATLTKAGYLADMDMKNLDNRQQAAVQNARNFLQMDLQNLQNEQQAAIVNAQAKQQLLLSNHSAKNAAENLNVQSRNQMKQFEEELSANISKFNASQRNAMERFNVGEQNAAARFNAEMQNQRQQFNVQNRIAIDQFNAQYRRQVNTQNTQMQNRANFVNAKNTFNMSQTAMNNALQYVRDQESFVFQASENHLDRASNEAIAMLNNEAAMNRLTENLDAESESALYSVLGSAAFNITTEVADDIDWGDISLFGGGDDATDAFDEGGMFDPDISLDEV